MSHTLPRTIPGLLLRSRLGLPHRAAAAAAAPSRSSLVQPSCSRALSSTPTQRLSGGLALPQAQPGSATGSHNASTSGEQGTPGPLSPAVNADGRSVTVQWSSGIRSRFHHIWLRDHCRCAECYHPKTKQRLVNTFSIPPDVNPTRIESTTEGLQVTWPAYRSSVGQDNVEHNSLYPWRWLMHNSYSPPLAESRRLPAERILWGKGVASAPPMVNYEEVMQSEEGVLKWLTKIAQFGFSFVSGVPATPEDTEALVRRIAFIRETHYGGFWDFTSNLEHGDTAYTNLALQAHTDTTYFTDPAGLQLFHLLSHTESSESNTPPSGGESLLVDGFLAAQVLKEVHPDAYDILSKVTVNTHSAGDDSTLVRPLFGGYPILQHDPVSGELVLVRYNNDDRSVLRLDGDDVEPFYDALRKWHEILTNQDGEYWTQLQPGTAMIFDNHRVLHGRSAFVGNRRLCGAYVSHDDYRSRLAVLRAQYGNAGEIGSSSSSSSMAAGGGAGTAGTVGRVTRGVWDDGL